jgi:hypothetical protein
VAHAKSLDLAAVAYDSSTGNSWSLDSTSAFYGTIKMTNIDLKIPHKPRQFWCNMIAAAFAILVVSPIVVMIGDRRMPIIVTGGEIVENKVFAGDMATFEWSVIERRIGCDGLVKRTFIDSQGTRFDVGDSKVVFHDSIDLERKKFRRQIPIPSSMHWGDATYNVHVIRWCNVLQKIFWPIRDDGPSVKFHIEPRVTPAR